jgi:luciferase family oxidoreductase group 1
VTARALRRPLDVDTFPQDVVELLGYFREPSPGQPVRAIPGAGLHVPVWILGSSLFGAQLAAELGLPYAFASHFAPALMEPAIRLYRERFRYSSASETPRLMLGVNVVGAATDAEARRLFTSHQQAFVALRRGRLGPLPPPIDDLDAQHAPQERLELQHTLATAGVGSPATVRGGLARFLDRTGADELIVVAQIHDHAARLRSYEIAAEAMAALVAPASAPQSVRA